MKRKNLTRTLFLAVMLPVLLLISCTKKQNWTQFRGSEGTMSIAASNLPAEWGTDKNVLWQTDLDGTGYSSPVVWNDMVFITSAFPEKVNPAPERPAGPPPQAGQGPQGGPPSQAGQSPQGGQAPQQGQRPPQPAGPPVPEVRDTSYMNEIYKWEVICFDLATGRENWRQTACQGAPKAGKNPNSTYACETPVTNGKQIVASFGMHGIFCYDMEGNLVWQKDPGVYYTQRGWGTGSSPVIYNDKVFIQTDNEENSFLVALDIATGNELWRVTRDEKTTYSTPFIWKNKSGTELVTTGKTARSYDPETGKLLWELKLGGEQVIPSPTGDQELLYLGNAGGRDAKSVLFAVKAGTSGEVAWQTEESGLANPSPLLYNGLLYVIGGRGEIAVLDATDGSLKYQKRISGIGSVWSSPWAFNERVYFFDENGTTRVFKAGPAFEQVAENSLEGEKFWASVAVAGDSYIFRSGDKLYCIKN